MRPTSIALPLLAFALTAVVPPRASACSCTNFPEFQTAFTQSAAIFLGEVIEITSAAPEYTDAVWVTFNVETCWKGGVPQTYAVLTPANEGICGVTFQPGERWLVYALGEPGSSGSLPAGVTWVGSCWRSHMYWAEDPDLALLGPTPVASRSWGSLKIRYR